MYQPQLVLSLQVQYTVRDNFYDMSLPIASLGGFNNGFGFPWQYSEEKIIRLIENKICRFFVFDGKHRAEVIVAQNSWYPYRKYLKTVPDGIISDNLDSLPWFFANKQ